jgi:hypothetical protein
MPTLNLFQIHPLRCAGLVGLENDADYLSATESPLWLGRNDHQINGQSRRWTYQSDRLGSAVGVGAGT